MLVPKDHINRDPLEIIPNFKNRRFTLRYAMKNSTVAPSRSSAGRKMRSIVTVSVT